MKRCLPVAVTAAALLLAAATEASARDRFVSPAGVGSGTCLSRANACELGYAATQTTAGDDVELGAGTYVLSDPLAFDKGEMVHGDRDGVRPLIRGATSGALLTVAMGGRVEYLKLTQGSGSPALAANSSTAVVNVIASSTGSGPGAEVVRMLGGGTIRELVASTTATGTPALRIGGSNADVRNVTLFSSGSSSPVLVVDPFSDQAPRVTLRNTIVRGGNPAISVEGISPSRQALFDVGQSNYVGLRTVDTRVVLGAVQSEPPAFVNAAAGDFRQLPGSPTRNAGINVQLSATDIDGDVRVNEGTADIGADEYVAGQELAPAEPAGTGPSPPPDVAPVLGLPSATPTRFAIPGGTTFRFTLSKPATVRIAIRQARRGKRSGADCVTATSALPGAEDCVRLVSYFTLTREVTAAGRPSVPFSGRFAARTLAPGPYCAFFTATDSGGRVSRTRRVNFTVVRG